MRVPEGFRKIVIHAGREAAVTVAFHGIGRKCNDRHAHTIWMSGGLERANGTCGIETVQLRHVAVHQNCIESLALERGNGFKPFLRQLDVATEALQHRQRDDLVNCIVFGEQDTGGEPWLLARGLRDHFDACRRT